MADNGYKFEDNKLVDWGKIFSRGGAVPFERSQLFDSYEDAVNYAKGDGSDKRKIGKTSYIGQIISVVENNTVSAYIINHSRELSDVSKPVVLSSQVVMSGEVRELESSEITSEKPQGTYIILTLDNANRDKLYIPVSSLVYTYTGDEYINVDKDNYTIVLNFDKIVSAIEENHIIISKFANAIKITYYELRLLRDKGKLIPGQQYRITDYIANVDLYGIGSNNKGLFDIIVVALSENDLCENAKATHHEDDTYFANNKLSEWELKYCIDNDVSRFEWAIHGDAISQRTTYTISTKDDIVVYGTYYYAFVDANGSLVYSTKQLPNAGDTLYMYENDWFEGWIMVDAGIFSSKKRGKGVIYSMKDEFGNEAGYDFKHLTLKSGFETEDEIIGIKTDKFYYTFNIDRNEISTDHSLTGKCKNNVIKPYTENGIQKINHIIFNHIDLFPECRDNFIDTDSKDILFGGNCFNNTVGKNCCQIKMRGNCRNNTLGSQCDSVILGQGCERNVIMDKCEEISIQSLCTDNIFLNKCYDIRLGNFSSYNTFGICSEHHTLGKYCTFNKYESYTSHITFSTDGQDSDYCRYNHFENGVKNITFDFIINKPSSSLCIQNIHALQGNYPENSNPIEITLGYNSTITISPERHGITSSFELRIDYGIGEFIPHPANSSLQMLTSEAGVTEWKYVEKLIPQIIFPMISHVNPNRLVFFNGIKTGAVEIQQAGMASSTGFEGVYYLEMEHRFIARFRGKYYTVWDCPISSMYDYLDLDNDNQIRTDKVFVNTTDGVMYEWNPNNEILEYKGDYYY